MARDDDDLALQQVLLEPLEAARAALPPPTTTMRMVEGVQITSVVTTTVAMRDVLISITDCVVSAACTCGALALRVAPGAYFFAMGRQDIKVGHERFDDRFIVESSDPDAAKWWLSEALCDALLSTYEPTNVSPFVFELADDQAQLRSQVVVRSRTQAHLRVPGSDAAIAAIVACVQRNVEIAEDMANRAAQIGGEARGSVWHADERFQLLFHVAGCDVTIDFPWRVAGHARGGLRTRLRMSIAAPADFAIWRKGETWEMPPRSKRVKPQGAVFDKLALGDIVDDANEEFRTTDGPWRMFAYASSLPLPTLPAIAAKLGFDWAYVSGSTLALGWERMELEPTRWLAAMRELASLVAAQNSAGPYR